MKSKAMPYQLPSLSSMATTVILLFFSTGILQIRTAQGFNCDLICFSDYSTSFPPDCEVIVPTLECYYNHQELCTGPLAQSSLGQVLNDHELLGCDPIQTEPEVVPTTEPVATVATTMVAPTTVAPVVLPSCPRVPSFISNPTTELPSPEIFPTMASRDCVEYNPLRLQHCSLFGYSNLRPFRSYRSGLEACNIPGSWYLLRHRTVSIEVEGVASGATFDHTKLSKVNVTFHRSGSCLRETKSYVATLNAPLPHNFTDQTVTGNCSANLQLSVDADGTVVSLLATWINTTIVIRRHADLLSVMVQVPGHLAFESDGLCRGCPAHAYLNMSRFNDLMSSFEHCDVENRDATYLCFFDFANRLEFDSIRNATYHETCIYSLWRGNTTDYDVLSFLVAVSNDAKMLPDQGYVPPRTYETITLDGVVDPALVGDLCNPRETNSSDPGDPGDTTETQTPTVTIINDSSDSVAHSTKGDSNIQTTTTQRESTEQSPAATNKAQAENAASATGKNQSWSSVSLLSMSLLSSFIARLLLR